MDVGPIFYSNNGNVTLSSRLDKIRIYKSFYLDTYFNLVWSMEICTLVESMFYSNNEDVFYFFQTP